MGRKKIEMRQIEDNNKRVATFRKRKNGIFKKAKELHSLTGAELCLTIVHKNQAFKYCTTDFGKANCSAINKFEYNDEIGFRREERFIRSDSDDGVCLDIDSSQSSLYKSNVNHKDLHELEKPSCGSESMDDALSFDEGVGDEDTDLSGNVELIERVINNTDKISPLRTVGNSYTLITNTNETKFSRNLRLGKNSVICCKEQTTGSTYLKPINNVNVDSNINDQPLLDDTLAAYNHHPFSNHATDIKPLPVRPDSLGPLDFSATGLNIPQDSTSPMTDILEILKLEGTKKSTVSTDTIVMNGSSELIDSSSPVSSFVPVSGIQKLETPASITDGAVRDVFANICDDMV